MIGAVVRDDVVDQIIVLDEAQIDELQAALECEIVDARPYGLAEGDLRTAAGWTRNAGGEQTILPLLEQEAYDSYSIAAAKAAQLEAAQETVAGRAADEAMAIISGEVEA